MQEQDNYKYITKRKGRGTYQVSIPVKDKDTGKKKRIVKQAKTFVEALKIRKKLIDLYHLDGGALLLAVNESKKRNDDWKNKTLEEVIEPWYKEIKEKSLSPASIYKYRRAYNLIISLIGDKRIKDIDDDMLKEIITRAEHATSKKNASNMLIILRQFYKYKGLEPIVMTVKGIGANWKKKESLTQEEVKKILRHIDKYHADKSLLYRLYFLTGCRRGEILGLTWRYVDFENDCFYIRKTLIKDEYNHEIILKDGGKTKASSRTVYIPHSVMETLKKNKEERSAGLDDFVFVNRSGKRPFWPDDITEFFRRARVACGIKKHVSLHSARHTFATRLAGDGVPIPVIQAMGGWSNPRTLLNNYMHTDQDALLRFLHNGVNEIWSKLI